MDDGHTAQFMFVKTTFFSHIDTTWLGWCFSPIQVPGCIVLTRSIFQMTWNLVLRLIYTQYIHSSLMVQRSTGARVKMGESPIQVLEATLGSTKTPTIVDWNICLYKHVFKKVIPTKIPDFWGFSPSTLQESRNLPTPWGLQPPTDSFACHPGDTLDS